MLFGSRLFDRHFLRRLVGLLALVGVLSSTCPLPLARKAWQPGQTPFPCQSCGCGCTTAEQCWSSCCCFSLSERIAWARKHGAPIPESVAKRSKAHVETAPQVSRTCCASSRSCCSSKPSATETRCTLAAAAADQGATESVRPSKLVTSLQAIECQGGATAFTLLPWAIVKKCWVELDQPQPLVEFSPLIDEFAERAFSMLDPPPPRYPIADSSI